VFRSHCKRGTVCFIRKDWLVDPLMSAKFGSHLRIISFTENDSVIEKSCTMSSSGSAPTPAPPRVPRTLETDADFPAWEAAGWLVDGID
jgi:hypothetical protein